MKTMRLAAFLALFFGVAAGVMPEDQPEQTNDVHEFMVLKLDHSKEVLAGLALEDFDQIAKHSQELSLLSQEASWKVLQTEEYLQQSMEFRRAADSLNSAARKKNLDAATLAFVDLTMKCVNCHRHVRDVRTARRSR